MGESIPTAVLMCHAPIVVPGIAGPREARRCQASTAAMRQAAQRVVAANPDAVVIVSPHAPRHDSAWLVASDPRVEGDFGRFGAPQVAASVPFGRDAASAVLASARRAGLTCQDHVLGPLDHGTLVPLWFLVEAGWSGPTVRIALPMRTRHPECESMGRAVADAASARNERWAFVASGDMSHRLLPGAPSGYDPEAQRFDDAVVRCVEIGRYRDVRRIDVGLRERAAEDVVDSLTVATGAIGGQDDGSEVLSYEGPFGVGYLVAVLRA